jgi:hypothetical protein
LDRGEREGRIAGLITVATVASLLLIPADLRPSLPATLIMGIAVTAGSAVWLAGAREGEFSIPSRAILAMGFGWVHGLGFASVLQDLHLPRSKLVPTLLGFNVGVEIGQLLAVFAVVALIKTVVTIAPAARQRPDVPAAVASAALLAAGLAWFLTRAVAVG